MVVWHFLTGNLLIIAGSVFHLVSPFTVSLIISTTKILLIPLSDISHMDHLTAFDSISTVSDPCRVY